MSLPIIIGIGLVIVIGGTGYAVLSSDAPPAPSRKRYTSDSFNDDDAPWRNDQFANYKDGIHQYVEEDYDSAESSYGRPTYADFNKSSLEGGRRQKRKTRGRKNGRRTPRTRRRKTTK